MRRSIYPNGSGGGSGDFVSLTTFDTYAELDAQAAEDGNLGLVASGTAGEPRLFRYATDTWVPDEPTAWTVATTGAGVMSGLIDAAGAAVYPGDLGVDGNATVYYAVGAAGRCAFVPRSIAGGIIFGETHTPTLRALWYNEDPATADDVSGVGTPSGTVTYASGTGLTTIVNQASVQVGPGSMIPSTVDGWIAGVVDAQLTQGTRSGGGDAFWQASVTDGAASLRYRMSINGSAAQYDPVTAADPTALHDASLSYDGTTERFCYQNAAPATDDAVPTTTTTTTEASDSARTWSLLIQVSSDASDPTFVLRGAYVVTWEAI